MQIRTMTAADIVAGMRLKAQAGWNQLPSDWERFLQLQPDGCFVAEDEGQVVGTTVACRFGSVAWIAMVLVDEARRGHGIATRLMQHAIEHSEAAGATSVLLQATPLGERVYRKLGFVPEHTFWLMAGPLPPIIPEPGNVVVSTATPAELEEIAALDCQITGTSRRRLLEALGQASPCGMLVACCDKQLAGYGLIRPGSIAPRIGPLVAATPEAGTALIEHLASHCAGQRVIIDMPEDNPHAVEWAARHGLVRQRPLLRMVRGQPIKEDPSRVWASTGPELG